MAVFDLLWRTLFVVFLVALPCAAACFWLLRRRLITEEEGGFAALVSLGLTGFVSFFVWLLWPLAGSALSVLLLISSAVQVVRSTRRSPNIALIVVRNVVWPLGLTCAAALIVLSFGFWFGGMDRALETAAKRFSHPLPGDNSIPLIFANNVAHHQAALPILGDWHSSDRPPLQTGISLGVRVFLRGEKNYSVLGSVLQSLWIFSAWLLLKAFRTQRRLTWLILTTVLFSGFVFVNTFFVWPKLLAGVFSLAAYAACWLTHRKALWAGLLAALAMLSHGGAVFFLIPVLVLLMLTTTRRQFALAIVSSVLLYVPWSLYQRFYDPPGDRLLKWHIGGYKKPTEQPFLQVLADSYSRAGWGGALTNKEQNLVAVFGKERDLFSASAWRARASTFFYFLPCLGFLVIGAFTLPINLMTRKIDRRSVIAYSWAVTTSSLLVWCLLMFGPGSTFVHQSAYATVLLTMMLCIESLWTLNRGFALFVCGAQIGLSMLLHAPAMHMRPQGTPVPMGAFEPGMFLLSIAALASFVWLLKAMPDDQNA